MVYVHVPFCHRKCAYCAFYSVPGRGRVGEWLDAVGRELEARLPLQLVAPETLYVGGGTPSLLSVEEHRRLKAILDRRVRWHRLREATLEANPEDLSADYLQGLRELGWYNRLSVGVQSFDDSELRAINRRHSAAEAAGAVVRAREAGFGNISIDLIYGLPGQTLGSWRRSLEVAFALPVDHLSAYALSVEPGTLLERMLQQGRGTLPPEDEVMAMYALLQERVAAEGWEQYEISSYCRDRRRSLHNSRYWRHVPYLGLGPGAHSLRRDPVAGCWVRRWNAADVAAYVDRQPFDEERLTTADLYNEWLMLGLRTRDGLDLGEIPDAALTDRFLDGIATMVARGWVVREGDRFLPTPEGLLHADGMASELFAVGPEKG